MSSTAILTPPAVAPESSPISHRAPRVRLLMSAGNPLLRQVSMAVDVAAVKVDAAELAQLQALIDDMLATMYEHRGVGLSAVQVGVQKRVIVADITGDGGRGPLRAKERQPVVIVNPVIRARGGGVTSEEGCLSLPEVRVRVRRNQRVQVTGFDRSLEPIVTACDGLLARVVQHEIDHLNGVLMTDRALR